VPAGFQYRLQIQHRGFEPYQSVHYVSAFSPTATCCAYMLPAIAAENIAVIALLHQGITRRIRLSVLDPRGARRSSVRVQPKKDRALSLEKQAAVRTETQRAEARFERLQQAALQLEQQRQRQQQLNHNNYLHPAPSESNHAGASLPPPQTLEEWKPREAKVIEVVSLERGETGLFVVQAMRKPGPEKPAAPETIQPYSFFQRQAASTIQRWVRRLLGEVTMRIDVNMSVVVYLEGRQYEYALPRDGVCRYLDPPLRAGVPGTGSAALGILHRFMQNLRAEVWTSCVLSVEDGAHGQSSVQVQRFAEPDFAMVEACRALNRARELELPCDSAEDAQDAAARHARGAAEVLLGFYLARTCAASDGYLADLAKSKASELAVRLGALAARGDEQLALARSHLEIESLEQAVDHLRSAERSFTHAGVLSRVDTRASGGGQGGLGGRALEAPEPPDFPPGEWAAYLQQPAALFGYAWREIGEDRRPVLSACKSAIDAKIQQVLADASVALKAARDARSRCSISEVAAAVEQAVEHTAKIGNLAQGAKMGAAVASLRTWVSTAGPHMARADAMIREARIVLFPDGQTTSADGETHTSTRPGHPAKSRQVLNGARQALYSLFDINADSPHQPPQEQEIRALEAQIAEQARCQEEEGEAAMASTRECLACGKLCLARQEQERCKLAFIRAGVEQGRAHELSGLLEDISAKEAAVKKGSEMLPQVEAFIHARRLVASDELLREALGLLLLARIEDEASDHHHLLEETQRLRRVLERIKAQALHEYEEATAGISLSLDHEKLADADKNIKALVKFCKGILASAETPALPVLALRLKELSALVMPKTMQDLEELHGHLSRGELAHARALLEASDVRVHNAPPGHEVVVIDCLFR